MHTRTHTHTYVPWCQGCLSSALRTAAVDLKPWFLCCVPEGSCISRICFARLPLAAVSQALRIAFSNDGVPTHSFLARCPVKASPEELAKRSLVWQEIRVIRKSMPEDAGVASTCTCACTCACTCYCYCYIFVLLLLLLVLSCAGAGAGAGAGAVVGGGVVVAGVTVGVGKGLIAGLVVKVVAFRSRSCSFLQ